METIIEPTLKGLVAEGIAYQGVLYAGLMLTAEGPYLLEFNARLGDPEAQAVLPRLKTDWVDLMEAVLEHHLDRLKLEWDAAVSVCVVLASDGYPGEYRSGAVIFGLHNILVVAPHAAPPPPLMVFHAGTTENKGVSVTAGGRVLGVTALGSDYQTARASCYQAIDKISFEGMTYRKDIGQ
jgi:phosphoribosylamine--glycine ligase